MPVDGAAAGSHILSIDYEEWFQVNSFAHLFGKDDWPGLERRLDEQTDLLLEMMDRHSAKATFFVVGWVAERYGALISRIAASGHEIASHSQMHRPLPDLGPDGFRKDLLQSKTAIEGLTGTPVIGFRAPNWSMSNDADWAPGILADCGFTYDSSIFPINLRYGRKDAPRYPYRHPCGLHEFPLSTLMIAGQNVPVGGGVFFRVEPLAVTELALKRYVRDGQPFVLYLHPWELDPAHPRIGLPLVKHITHYANLRSTRPKLEVLLSRYCFTSFSEYLKTVPDGFSVGTHET